MQVVMCMLVAVKIILFSSWICTCLGYHVEQQGLPSWQDSSERSKQSVQTRSPNLAASLAWCYTAQNRQAKGVQFSLNSPILQRVRNRWWVKTLGAGEHIPSVLSLVRGHMLLHILTPVAFFFKCLEARVRSGSRANQPWRHQAAYQSLIPLE